MASAKSTAAPMDRDSVTLGQAQLPFTPRLAADGEWMLVPTAAEVALDEERAKVSKLPRYVVSGNLVHGLPRYGVKIKIPGERGQVGCLFALCARIAQTSLTQHNTLLLARSASLLLTGPRRLGVPGY
jgi:hypothetical protein